TYHNTKVEISEDGITWTTLFDSSITGEYKETANGLVVQVNNSFVNSFYSRLSTAESSITQQAGQISSKVSQSTYDVDIPNIKNRLSSAESNITQQATDISLRVKTTDYNGNQIASLINQTATTIKLVASKIDLDGDVDILNGRTRIKDAVITNAKIESMSADKLTAGNVNSDTLGIGSNSGYRLVFGTRDTGNGGVKSSIYSTNNDGLWIRSQFGSVDISSPDRVRLLSVTEATNILLTGDYYISTKDRTWISPTFTNGWSNYSNGYEPAGYYKDPNNLMRLKGLVKGGNFGYAIFQLPSGYRPTYRRIFNVISYNGTAIVAGRVDIDASGYVYAMTGANAWLSLDGIWFNF
ncbi:hypothetical protein J1P26_18190, partial [Neobacillus sp. MM2021_6]|nr:hypothetical protein [Neobacillus sp. MM2021_6]